MSHSFIPRSKNDVFKTARIKYFIGDDGLKYPWQLIIFPDKVFKPAGFELSDSCKGKVKERMFDLDEDFKDNSKSAGENRRKAFGRAKNKLFDYALANTQLNYFVTLTFDKEEVDRYSYEAIIQKLNVWLANRVRRRGFEYIFVPEYHEDGAIHFHGLCNAEVLNLVKADVKSNKPVYNISDYTLGFSTAIPITGEKGHMKCAKYVYKYIIKSGGEMVGGRYYLHSRGLKKPSYKLYDIDYRDVNFPEIKLGESGICCKIVNLEGVFPPCDNLPEDDLTFLGLLNERTNDHEK